MARRQVSIFINGTEVENTIKGITTEKKKLVAELNRMTVGSEEYIATAGKIKSLNNILDDHRKGLSNIDKGYNLLTTGGLSKLAGLAAGAFSADIILSYGKELFNLSGQMQLLEQKARTVFGEVFPQVTAEAEKNAAAMGLTTSQYINAAAAAGDLLIPMGFTRKESADLSSQLVNLSGALSEWTGGQRSATEVSSILSKAILGEREELKSLGISISEEDVKNALRAKGLQNLTGTYRQQAEAIASVELILAKSTDAQTAFANNSDTLVRRQAALRAELTNIGEKLATTLFPIFEKLVGVASSFTEVIGYVSDEFTKLVNPVKAANDAFDEQYAKVSKLESELPALLNRYDQLKGKSKLTKDEQQELSTVIQRIGDITPTAITQIDKYGNALQINASKSKEFLATQKENLEILRQTALEETKAEVERLRKKQADIQKFIDGGVKKEFQLTGGIAATEKSTIVPLTEKETNAARNNLVKTTEELIKQEEKLFNLRNDGKRNTTTPPPATTTTTTTTTTKSGSSSKAKTVKDTEEEVRKILDYFSRENRLKNLNDDQKEIEALRQKYATKIAELVKLEKEGSKTAGAAIIQLKKEQDEAIAALEKELKEKRAKSDKESFDQLTDKLKQVGEDQLEIKKNLQNQINDFTLSEYDKAVLDLQTHYQQLKKEAEKYGLDTLAIDQAYYDQKNKLDKEQADKEEKEQKAKQTRQLTQQQKDLIQSLSAKAKAFSDTANIIGSIQSATDQLLGESNDFHKTLALAQIAFSTGAAIATGVEKAIAIGFPQNLPAIAVTIATVLSSVAQARAIVNQAPVVKQKYTGGFFDVTGETDGRTYNAQYIGSPGTGLLPNRPVVLASEQGPEYFIANQDLRNPVVLNYVRAIENIRAARTGSVPQFAEGGLTTPAGSDGSQGAMMALFAQLLPVLQRLDATLNGGIKAEIEDDTVIGINNRFKLLNRASGGVL